MLTFHSCKRSRITLLSLLLPLALASLTPAISLADTAKPSTSAETVQRAALREELRRLLVDKKLPAAGVERTLSQLDRLSMTELRDLANFAGARASGAERLAPGLGGQASRDRAGELTGSRGGSSVSSGSGLQRGVTGALDPRGGINDTRGHAAAGADTCAACPNTASGRNPEKHDANGDGPRVITTHTGNTIKIYGDGSASITSANGKAEYLNSGGKIVDDTNNPVPNATPRPDDQSPVTSTRITKGDIERINGVLGQRSTPNPNDTGSVGGPVDAGKADRTGGLGLFTDTRPGAGYVSKVDLEEVLRIAIEKLQGPQVGK